MSEELRVANREYTSTVAHLSPLDIRIWEEGELINRGMEAYEEYSDEPFWLLEGNDVVFEANWLAASPVTGAWDYHWRLEAYGNAAAYELEAYGTEYQQLSWNAPVREGWYAIYLKAEDTEVAVNYYEVDSVFQLLPATGWTPFATMRSVQGMGAALPGAAAQGAEAFSNVANGNLLARCGVYAPDANAVGVAWDLTLAYNSQLPTRSEGKHPTEDLFGQSWHCAAFPRVEINPQNYFDLPHHLIVKALDSSGHPRLFHRRADGSFTRPRGIFEDCLRWGSGWALWKHDGSLWIFDAEGKLEAQYQWGGRSWHAYEYSGGQIRIQDNYNRVVMLQRDEDGRVVCLTDSQAPQAVTYFQYTSGGRLQRAKDGLGNTTQFSYVADGDIARLQWVKDAEGGITYFSVREYDTPVDARVYGFAGELQDTTDAEGYPTYYTYEALDAYGSERKTAVLNARTYAFEYETEGLVTRKLASPLGRVTYFRFDSKTYLTEEVTDAEGYGWQYTYDDDGCVTQFATPLDSTPSWGYQSRRVLPLTGVDFGSLPKLGGGYVMGHYGPRGDGVPGSYYGDYPWINIGYKNVLVRATNAEGHTWQSELNDFGDVIRREDALQNADVYERHFLGMCEMWTDRELRVWQYRYDDTTALIGTTDPEGYESTFDYQGHERVRTVDPAQAAWETDYLDNGWVQRSRDPLNHETLNAYNTVGRTTQTTDPRGNAAAFEYTARQLPSEATDRSGQTTEALYDPIGLTYETVDEKGYSTQRAHDPDNRVECVEDAEGHLTYYEYDQNGRLVKTTGARGYEWLTYYDPDGRAPPGADRSERELDLLRLRRQRSADLRDGCAGPRRHQPLRRARPGRLHG
jgi:YD repeat-containing protein